MVISPLLLLAGGLTLGGVAPAWQSDYSSALKQSQASHRPVAVVLQSGTATESIPPAAAEALNRQFVCVYADVTTPAGRELAGKFRLTEGMVISDRDGRVQAVRHQGKVTPEVAAAYATQFANPQPVVTTHTAGYSPVVPASAAVVGQPLMQAAPVYSLPTYAAPAYSGYPGMVVGGGCANGRCGR